jgi:hypothetical protein
LEPTRISTVPIQTHTDREKQLTINKVMGEVSFEEAMATLNAFYSGNPTLNVIWDLTEGTIRALSSEQLEMIADALAPASKKRMGGKTAGVAPADIDFGMARMFGILVELTGYKPEVRIFRELKDAVDWVKAA